MGWWFGRKSAPADARPFVPAWLNSLLFPQEQESRCFEGSGTPAFAGMTRQ